MIVDKHLNGTYSWLAIYFGNPSSTGSQNLHRRYLKLGFWRNDECKDREKENFGPILFLMMNLCWLYRSLWSLSNAPVIRGSLAPYETTLTFCPALTLTLSRPAPIGNYLTKRLRPRSMSFSGSWHSWVYITGLFFVHYLYFTTYSQCVDHRPMNWPMT